MSKKIKPINSTDSQVRSRNLKIFATQKKVEKYAEENDKMLVIFENKVYDLTKFQYEHPGGQDILEDYQGHDVTDVFYNSTRHRHSQYAYNLLQKYIFGEIGDEKEEERQSLKNQSKQEYPLLTHENKLKYNQITLDLDKGLVQQIAACKDRNIYEDMMKNPCRRIVGTRLFENEIVDTLFNNNIGIVVVIYILIFTVVFYSALDLRNNYSRGLFDKHIKSENLPLTYLSLLFGIGMFIFWVMEYVYLRFLIRPLFLGKTCHFLFFGVHYIFPLDKARTTIQPVFSLSIGLALRYGLGQVIYGNTLYLILSGICFGYIIYEIVHYALHNKKELTFGYSQGLRKRHAKHHFKDRDFGYQVTNHFWDKFFDINNLEEEDRLREIKEEKKLARQKQKVETPPDSSDSD